MIFESHAHYDDKQFDKDRDQLLSQMKDNQIGYVVNIGADLESTRKSLILADQYAHVYAAVGVHPSEAGQLNEETFTWLKEQTSHAKCVAIGEIGLDYYWDKESDVRDNQKYWFRQQLTLARETRLPVVIHSRDAAKDTYDIMKEMKAGEIGGVVHCFSYSVEMARSYLNMGFYIGVGGVVTFNNARVLKEVVDYTPLEAILLETDCPYLAPVPNRGKRNSSYNLPFVAEKIAQIKGVSVEDVIEITCQNAKNMYRI